MINGIFLDPRTWKIDFLACPFWKPEEFGIKIDLHPAAEKIPDVGIDGKYKFVIATEVWEKSMQRTLYYLRKKGLKIFLVPREPVLPKMSEGALFNWEHFRYGDACFFNPDMLLASGQAYADFWNGITRTEIIGYPRFEQYLQNFNINKIKEKYDISTSKKIIFFPSFNATFYKKENGKDTFQNVSLEHETIMQALEQLSQDEHTQVVVKVHPMSQKIFLKTGKDITGTLKKYYINPSKKIIVIKDERNNGLIAKQMLAVADLVVGLQSTMLLEAVVMKKPVLNIMLDPIAKIPGLFEYEEEMLTARNKQEIVNMVRGNIPVIENSKLVERYLYKVDGNFCRRLCDVINREIK